MAKTTPASRCQEAVSWKNKMPAMAIIAAPPAKMAPSGTSSSTSDAAAAAPKRKPLTAKPSN